MKKQLHLSAILLVALVLGTAGWLVADDDDEDHHENERHGRTSLRTFAPVTNATWKEECSSCHMLYLPGLLPERSWRKMMGSLDQHFGDDASLDPAVREEITRFLVANSADRSPALRSRKIAQSIAPSDAPLRISQTDYFLRKHDEIRPAVFKRKAIGSASNCVACHKNAETGVFDEEQVRIPRDSRPTATGTVP